MTGHEPTIEGGAVPLPDAVVVVDGSADEIIASLTAAGWTLAERVELVAGKRIRYITPPDGEL